MVKGIVLRADPDLPVEISEFSCLEDCTSVVGGWIEAVDIPSLRITVWVNEEGVLRSLPFNSRATSLWWYEVEAVRRKARLVGDAVIVGLPDRDGASTDVPEATRALLTEEHPYEVMVQYGYTDRWVPHPFLYTDFLEAVVWAMILTDRVVDARAVRIVNMSQLPGFGRDAAVR